MGRKEKLIQRLCRRPKDFTWGELETLLKALGYRESTKGRTGGSRRRFLHKDAAAIFLHKPHPGNILKRYAINEVIRVLKEEGLI